MSEIIEASSQQPSISSLSQHRVPIPNDIQDHLRRQYEHIGDDQGGVDHVTTATTPIDHFTRILNAMKVSPKGTICRVNLLLENSVDVVLEEINQYLSQLFCAEESISTCIADSTTSDNEQTHEGDGSEIVTRNVKFEARKHDIFHDVIEIHPSSSSIVNEATSLSSFTGIPQALCHRTGIFSHRSSSSRQKSNFPLHCKVVLCDRRCGEAVLRGSNIFVRGVLGADRKIERDDIVCVYSHVSADSIPSRGIQIESYQSGRCIFLGLGKAACTRAQMFNQSTGLAVIMFNNIMLTKNNDDGNEKYFTTKAGPLLPSMNGILSKKIMLQNLPSILVAHVLNPQSKDVIVDLCCAPGGKTSHVASLVNNDATIVAIDKSKKKMKTVKQFFQEMGASCITPLALDSTKCVLNVNEKNGQPWMSVKDVLSAATYSSDGLLDVKGFYPESFDKIVLDPPCSALGLRPKLAVDIKSVKELNKHADYQRRFIQCAVSLLKPGGILVYSTCTINACENEEMVKYILDNFINMKLLPIDINIGLPGLAGCGLNDAEQANVRRFDPSDAADTMGFFVAKFQKSAGEGKEND